MKTLLVLVGVSLCFSVQARLGETEQQLTKRYGPVVYTKMVSGLRMIGETLRKLR